MDSLFLTLYCWNKAGDDGRGGGGCGDDDFDGIELCFLSGVVFRI